MRNIDQNALTFPLFLFRDHRRLSSAAVGLCRRRLCHSERFPRKKNLVFCFVHLLFSGREQLLSSLNLTSRFSMNNVHLWSADGSIRRYSSPAQIIDEHFDARLTL